MEDKFKNISLDELEKLALGKLNKNNKDKTIQAGYAYIQRLENSNDLKELKSNYKRLGEFIINNKRLHDAVRNTAIIALRRINAKIYLLENSEEFRRRIKKETEEQRKESSNIRKQNKI